MRFIPSSLQISSALKRSEIHMHGHHASFQPTPRLPTMKEKNKTLCVLCASAVKLSKFVKSTNLEPKIIMLTAYMLILSSCATADMSKPHPYEDYLNRKGIELPDPDKFQHCRSYGCATIDQVSLTKKEWARVTSPFKKAKTPMDERKAISDSIARFEDIVGEKTGTSTDVAGTFYNLGPDQLDCVDESTNTTVYLAMLERKNILKHHKVTEPLSRTPVTNIVGGLFWPHQTATIFESKSGTSYVVDSWFRDNGYPADIIPAREWIYGWKPDDTETKTAVVQ